jgi:hypothetical protein
MGTWKLTGFTDVIFSPVGDEPSYWWNLNVVPDSSPDLDNQGSASNKSVWGFILVRLHTGQLYLDGSLTPTEYDDLPDDFGIDAITYEQNPPWMRNGVDLFTPNFPITSAGGGLGVHVFRGGAGAYYWTIEPVGLSEYQTNQGLVAATLTLADPYLGLAAPPVYTKWNTFLRTFLRGSTFRITFSQMSAQFGAYWMFVFTQFASVGADGIAISNEWEINGTYDSYPPPTNPTIYPLGGLAFGGSATIQALTDASGIYTLVEGQYHDELYQRVGTTGSTTISVQIPMPFFKTGYIGSS